MVKKIPILILSLAMAVMATQAISAAEVRVLELDGIINPVAASYIHDNILQAEEDNAECMIIQMDTPGGLMTSMRDIIKDILNSKVPVVVYVFPRGAQAASAGVFITASAHFAAMAPGTNIGAAHPVTMGGGGFGGEKPDSAGTETMMEKVTNDAVAFIRSIAEQRGRNADWLEQSVRKSVSITETEAVKKHVVDLVAKDRDELLEWLDGKTVKLAAGKKTIHTKDATIVVRPLGIARKILDIISDPTVAYLLLMLGFYGIYFEFANPGAIFPGVLGGIFLILAFFSFQILPINYAGLALIVVGIVLFILEVKIVSFGLLTIGGIISMLLGSMMLIDVTNAPKALFSISLSVIIPIVLFSAAFFIVALMLTVKTHQQKPTTGKEGLLEETGIALTDVFRSGMVAVHGEYWQAISDEPIEKGSRIVVRTVDRMTLKVEKILIES
ncbi:MAG: serine protease [Candidatus Marinimicrobia bacterium CG08_land_8_20_14_0_20_45_22]|nr:MAG: serine protease [Candidatus Marinimicrobia bacterium CG08_land_8_20_14_0_20_45_22]